MALSLIVSMAATRRTRGAATALAALVALLIDAQCGALAAPTFADVAPIFNSRCTACHAGPAACNGLRLDSYASVLTGAKRGPVLIAGSSRSSELVKRIRGESQPRMPLSGPPYLSEKEIGLIEAWIQAGAPRGVDVPATPPPDRAAPAPGAPVAYAEVEPILLTRCVKCHAESGGQMGAAPEGFVLRTYEQTLAVGERVRIVPGNPGASELLRRVKGLSRPRMPFDGPPWLADDEIALIERWIAQGARDRDGKPAPIPVGAAVRFRGTLTGPGEIDGMPFTGAGRGGDRSPAVGNAAELRGVVEADGTIRATRIRAR